MCRIKAGWGFVRARRTVGNTLKGVWNRIQGRGNKDFKKRGQAGSSGECLKKGGGGARTPYMIVKIQLSFLFGLKYIFF